MDEIKRSDYIRSVEIPDSSPLGGFSFQNMLYSAKTVFMPPLAGELENMGPDLRSRKGIAGGLIPERGER